MAVVLGSLYGNCAGVGLWLFLVLFLMLGFVRGCHGSVCGGVQR